jgi:Cdc6-like AAA superfamily ATPase
MLKYNPFRPNSIVTPGMFSGRYDEMKAIEQALFQTKHGNPKHFIVSGERGIGKSSLFLYVDLVARGTLKTFDQTHLNFLVITVELVGSTTYDDIVTCVANEFKAEISRRQAVKEFAKAAWDFVTSWKVMGIEYKKADDRGADDVTLIDSLCDGIARFLTEAGCPSSDDLRPIRRFEKGGSGSSGVRV